MYSKLGEEKNLREVADLFYTFLGTPDEIEKYAEFIEKASKAKLRMQSTFSCECVRHYNIEILNLFDPEIQLINIIYKIKNKLKDLSGKIKKFIALTILFLEYKNVDDHKSMSSIFQSNTKLIVDESDIEKAFDQCINLL